MSRQQIKTLRTLLDQPADNCVALTYNLDLPFFEYVLFEPLYHGGCRNVTVLCDPGQHEIALDDVPALKYLGQRYLCLPATMAKAAFHPKLMLLTTNDEGLLLLGSGNISRSGLTHNQEVWTRFYYTNEDPDEFARAACWGAFDYLSRLAEAERSPMLGERLDQLRRTTQWLRREPTWSGDAGCWTLHNLDSPVMDQLVERYAERDGSPVLEAIVVSPYFDKGSLAFAALLEKLRPKTVSLVTEREAPGLDPEGLRRLAREHGARLSPKRPELGPRRLHAKALALRTERGGWLLTGSPNFSRPAMLRSAQEGNVELAVLRHEPDPAFVDFAMAPIREKVAPLVLDWKPIAEETDEGPTDGGATYRLVRAEFADNKLAIFVEPDAPKNSPVRIELAGRDERHFRAEWPESDGEAILLEPPADLLGMFSSPVSVRLVVGTAPDQAFSSRAVVNVVGALRANSRPLRRQDQVRVPARLVSEDFEQDIDLLNRLHILLALNPQELRKRRGLSGQVEKELEREDAMTQEEGDYDPEAMVVEERLRRIEVRTGSDLYVDFYERAFYEDVLAAARAAVYRPLPDSAPDLSAPPDDGTPPEESQPPKQMGGAKPSKSAAERVTRSFARLVSNFERGMQDSEYLAQVPPTYLLELFFILITYLRSLWRQKLVDDDNFIDFSERLFSSFLGDEQGSSGWSAISDSATEERLAGDKYLSHYREQAWLHLYVLADHGLADAEERLPYLARLMRLTALQLAPPTVISDLPAEIFAAMWRNSFSRDRAAPELEDVVKDLLDYSQWYSEITLRQELAGDLQVRVNTERTSDWNLPAVPVMRVEGAWSDEHLDAYWRAFCKFCRWPSWKKNARLEVRDPNSLLSGLDAKRLILFYRGDSRRLSVLVNPDSKALACRKQINDVTVKELCEKQDFGDVMLL